MSWRDVQDPEGRLRKGQRIRWAHSAPDSGDMVVLNLCAPCGLYRRPLKETDTGQVATWLREDGKTEISCEPSHPEAVYHPEWLMVRFRYLSTGAETTGCAVNMVVVSEECP